MCVGGGEAVCLSFVSVGLCLSVSVPGRLDSVLKPGRRREREREKERKSESKGEAKKHISRDAEKQTEEIWFGSF